MPKSTFDRRVDRAMETASAGLQIPLSQLNAMGKLCRQAAVDRGLAGVPLVQECRAIMIQQGATEIA